ncbi:MAG TPA: hypothetical protein VMO26_25780 [Vicinamibacterales bacterium]|nr:hypothetical protein [Vicinamibacterales bacterium]
MATELSREELRRLARLGAERRLEELRKEEAAIRKAFPDLGGRPGGASAKRGRRAGRAAAAGANDSAPKAKRPARYKMSAAQKRAVSERMKKYWAARRKGKG